MDLLHILDLHHNLSLLALSILETFLHTTLLDMAVGLDLVTLEINSYTILLLVLTCQMMFH
ncbi:hypothetical protein Pint_31455 [Pistacia integerrima]|uniref:Uncharacterized protein n=1 Tax=Pistacia integerrima TaxID=434235 RepID=A0ACC0XR34_9ROSI|nr:hypothetical protein Pint_31455 [Pistacia integerrima]